MDARRHVGARRGDRAVPACKNKQTLKNLVKDRLMDGQRWLITVSECYCLGAKHESHEEREGFQSQPDHCGCVDMEELTRHGARDRAYLRALAGVGMIGSPPVVQWPRVESVSSSSGRSLRAAHQTILMII